MSFHFNQPDPTSFISSQSNNIQFQNNQYGYDRRIEEPEELYEDEAASIVESDTYSRVGSEIFEQQRGFDEDSPYALKHRIGDTQIKRRAKTVIVLRIKGSSSPIKNRTRSSTKPTL